jgi:Mitochondrial carrier protein
MTITSEMWRQEGFRSFYKGITPRILRVAPGTYGSRVIPIVTTDKTPRPSYRIRCVRACSEAHRDRKGIKH